MKNKTLHLLFLAGFLLTSAVLSAQFVITDPDGAVGTSALADDVNVCFRQNNAGLTFRATSTIDGQANPEFTVKLPQGRTYVPASLMVLSSSPVGGFSIGTVLVQDNTITFTINGTFDIGEYANIFLGVEANCMALDVNGVVDTIVHPGGESLSTTHDALSLTLSIADITPQVVSVGDMLDLTGSIIGGGNGLVESFVFAIYDSPDITTNSLTIGGSTITADSTVSDTMYYTINSAAIMSAAGADGDGDALFEASEIIRFSRNVTINGCDLETGYKAFWGCEGERCFETANIQHPLSPDQSVPDVQWTGVSVEYTNACEPTVYRIRYTNVGGGNAFNVCPTFGLSPRLRDVRYLGNRDRLNRFALVEGAVTTDISFAQGDGTAGTAAYTVETNTLTGADPDGPGGLSDLNNDGVFNDLAPGESFEMLVYWPYDCLETCPHIIPEEQLVVSGKYENQCEMGFNSRVDIYAGVRIMDARDGVRFAGPTDLIGDGAMGEYEMAQGFTLQAFDCPNAMQTTTMTVPVGLNIVGDVITVNGVDISVTRIGETVTFTHPLQPNSSNSFVFKLELDCATYAGGSEIGFSGEYSCDPGCNCINRMLCHTFPINAVCVSNCIQGGLTLTKSTAKRLSYGFTDYTGSTLQTEANISEIDLKRAIGCDTVEMCTNAVQIGGLSSDWDNGYLYYDYPAPNDNVLAPIPGGEVLIYDASTNTSYTCPMPTPVETNIGGRHNITYEFLQLRSDPCLPADFELMADDTISARPLFTIVDGNNYIGGVPKLIEGMQIQFYNLKDTVPFDGTLDTLTCIEPVAVELYLFDYLEAAFVSPRVTAFTGCETQEHSFEIEDFRAIGGNYFASEVRPVYHVDSIEIFIPTGVEVDLSTARLLANGRGSQGYQQVLPMPNPDVVDGNRYVWYNGGNNGTFPIFGWRSRFSGSGYEFRIEYTATCASVDGSNVYTYHGKTNGWSDVCQADRPLTSSNPLSFTLPSHDVVNLSGVRDITTDTVMWNIDLRNTTNIASGNIFIALEEASSLGIDIIGAVDVVQDTALNLIDYADGQWIQVSENFAGQETKEIKLTALVNNCMTDSIKVKLGWDCTSYPTDPTTYPCAYDSVYLKTRSLRSQVQIELDQEPSPHQICTVIDDTITVTSALDAYITDLLLCIPLPDGLSESDNVVQIRYPAGAGGVIQDIVYTLSSGGSGDTIYVNLEDHTTIGAQGGLPGTQDAGGVGVNSQAEILLTWETDCDFVSAQSYSPRIYANRPCGDPAIGNGIMTVSDPILIDGTMPAFESVVSPDLGIDTLAGCEQQTVNVSYDVTIGMTGTSDTVLVRLPAGLDYVEGSFVCTSTATPAMVCLEFVEVRETPDGQVVVLKVPSGITNENMDFEIMVKPDPNASLCNEKGMIEVESLSIFTGINCATTGTTCPGIQARNGYGIDSIVFDRTKIEFASLLICEEDNTFYVDGELAINDRDLVAMDSIIIQVFCASDRVNPIDSIIVNGPVTAGSTVGFSADIASPCGASEDVLFSISRGAGNCVCSNLDSLTMPVREIPVSAGNDQAICSSETVDLTTIGASIGVSMPQGVWTTSGDGTFATSADFPGAETYIPGPNDIQQGEVVLTLTSNIANVGRCSFSNAGSVTITILQVDCGEFPWDGN